MTIFTGYLRVNSQVGGGNNHLLFDTGSAPSTVDSGGHTVGLTASGNYSQFRATIERAAATFGATALPNAVPDSSVGDAWVWPVPLIGSFAATAWDLVFRVIAQTAGASGSGRFNWRAWACLDQTGAGARELTSGARQTSAWSNLTTGTAQSCSDTTFSPGVINMRNEYLLINVAQEIVTASGSASADCILRQGAAARLILPDFTVGLLTWPRGLVGSTQAVQRASRW